MGGSEPRENTPGKLEEERVSGRVWPGGLNGADRLGRENGPARERSSWLRLDSKPRGQAVKQLQLLLPELSTLVASLQREVTDPPHLGLAKAL